MEPAVWPPYDFHLANWSMEPVGAAWVPDEFASSTEMLGTCFQTHVPSPGSSSGGQLQQVQYAAATPNSPCEEEADDAQNKMEIEIHDPTQLFEETAHEFEVDIDLANKKMHRYPLSIRRLGDWYTTPSMVAIGPYHRSEDHLKPAEKMKHVAAYHCITGNSVQEMYDAVVSVANETRGLYDKDALAGIGDEDFLPMMFYDACFLVQYMLTFTESEVDLSWRSYLDSNDNDIFRDVMLLENQLPWRVVETVMRFTPVPLTELISSLKQCLHDRKVAEDPLVWDDGYRPPHFLGLVRFYLVGRSSIERETLPETDSISFSVSAIELAEIGITLTPNKTRELIEMGVEKKGCLFAELSLAPLSLNEARSSWLVNMAAFELCTTLNFQAEGVKEEESAVCSHLLLLAMFVDREEDVHELRRKRLLQGGGGLTNKQALTFFNSLQYLPLGPSYVRVMKEIENYRRKRRKRTRSYAFLHKNLRIIVMIIFAVGALVGIFGTLMSLKKP